jgi:colicin import membrane protein
MAKKQHFRRQIGAMGGSATGIPKDVSLNRAIGTSVILHIAVFIAFAVRTVFYPSTPLLIEESIRVDIVGLPDKKTPKAALPPPAQEAPKPVAEKAPEPKAEVKPVSKPEPKVEIKPAAPTVNLDKSKQQQESALKRLEALQRLEKMVQKDQAQSTNQAAAAQTAPQPSAIIKGNEVSPGTALTGIARLSHQSYLASIQSYVRRQWNLPHWLANGNFNARVRIYLDSRGNVVKREMTQSSNNSAYDERVLQAIDTSSPLPAPPSDLANLLAVDGIEVDFVP